MQQFWRRHAILAFWLFVALALAALLLLPRGAKGQDRALTFEQQVLSGRQLAGRLCQACHLVGGASATQATAGIPSFSGIANRPGQTAAHIRGILIAPHPPMPDVQLSNPEIDQLLAFLESLRAAASGVPLAPRNLPLSKPQYPNPS